MSIEVAALRAEVKANQLQLQQQYEQTGDARGLLRQRSDQVDAVLKKLWDLLDFPASLAFAANDWEDPEIIGRNKLPPTATMFRFNTPEQAMIGGRKHRRDCCRHCLQVAFGHRRGASEGKQIRDPANPAGDEREPRCHRLDQDVGDAFGS